MASGSRERSPERASGRKTLWILKTGQALAPVRARRGDFETWMAAGLGLRLEEIAVASIYDGAPLPDLEDVAGILVTGSPAMVTERPPWSEAAARFLGKLVEADAVPMLGVCYGHQLVADGLGGEVGANPRGRELGTVELTLSSSEGESKRLFDPGRFPVHMSHVESVLRTPADAVVMATTDLEQHAILQFGPRQWGVQFHPEFDLDITRGYVEARREIVAGEGLDPDAMIETAREAPESSAILARFAAMVSEC